MDSDPVPGTRVLVQRYPLRASDLARFTQDPADASIGQIVDGASGRADLPIQELRAGLTQGDARALLLFARRQAAQALRESSPVHAVRAVETFTLIDRDLTDFRDLSFNFPLLACRELGEPVAEVIARAAARSAESTAPRLEAALGRVADLTLADCGLLEVHSSYGTGFMDSWTRRSGAAIHHSDVELGEIAVALADRIDAEGTYVTDRLAAAPLPVEWFSPEAVRSDIPTGGCVVVRCIADRTQPDSHGLTVFLADVITTAEAQQLTVLAHAASTDSRPRTALSTDRRLCLIIGGSATRGEISIETQTALGRFLELAAPLL